MELTQWKAGPKFRCRWFFKASRASQAGTLWVWESLADLKAFPVRLRFSLWIVVTADMSLTICRCFLVCDVGFPGKIELFG